jgi:hypothetical protein
VKDCGKAMNKGDDMKRVSCLIVVSLALLLFLSIASAGAGGGWKDEATALPNAEAQAVWNYITGSGYAENWKMWPGKTTFYEGAVPHGALLTTYVNSPALSDINEKKGMLSAGSIIVKENYSHDKKFVATSVMYKVKGYDPGTNDWFWAKYSPDGTVQASGRVEGCINCHAMKKHNDYIMTQELK